MDDTYRRPIYAMDNSPYSTLAASSTMKPATRSIAVTLTSVSDPSDSRHLIMNSGERVTIGRASKSEAKNLQAQSDNALFDCPVVSRQHAELKVHPFRTYEQQVTITDRESMHGTSVNGKRLTPYMPFSLKTGDHIKFGDKVTRGSDIHDGVIVSFNRANTTTTYSQPTLTVNAFHVPSDDSDAASDMDSLYSERGDYSSAQTTPEQSKAALGTQEAPIDVEADHTALRTVIDLDEDIPSRAEKKEQEQQKVVPDTYAESDYGEEDDVSVGEYGFGYDETDDLSESDASDLSNHDDASEMASEDEIPEDMSSRKRASPSPELGTPHDQAPPKPKEAINWRQMFEPPPPAMYGLNKPSYDPVRGTYGAMLPDPFTFGVAGPSHAYYPPSPAAPTAMPSFSAFQPVAEPTWSHAAPQPPLFVPMPSAFATKSKISIPDIVDESSEPAQEEEEEEEQIAVTTSDAPHAVEEAPARSSATKRKAAVISEDEEAEPSNAEWEDLYRTIHHDAKPKPTEVTEAVKVPKMTAAVPPAKKARTGSAVKSISKEAAKFAAAALAGGVGMAVFLASPLAEQLLA